MHFNVSDTELILTIGIWSTCSSSSVSWSQSIPCSEFMHACKRVLASGELSRRRGREWPILLVEEETIGGIWLSMDKGDSSPNERMRFGPSCGSISVDERDISALVASSDLISRFMSSCTASSLSKLYASRVSLQQKFRPTYWNIQKKKKRLLLIQIIQLILINNCAPLIK